jgi:N-acetylated-alpha-linked acidic dipeptidase
MKFLPAILLAGGFLLADSNLNQPIRGFSADETRAEHEREAQARSIPQADRIRAFARRLSTKPHAAGSPQSKANAGYIQAQLQEWGLDVHTESFEPLLPYPTARTLEMVSPARYVAQLREPAVPQDKDSGQAGQLPTYNAYSATGDVTAPLVYVNYGVPEDYDYLKQQAIDVKGKIVIARYGKSWRGVKPKLALEHGAVGCLIYSDPRDDGYFQGDVYPKGAYRPAQGVQRGSVVDMALYPGDPLTPGWASEKGARRLPRSEAKSLLKIPVLPISWGDAKPLLANLAGPVAPEAWRGALPITYHIGPGAATVHLKLDFDWTNKPIYDVIAKIPGSVYPDEWIVWGNHHDAWVNGASDPISGASALLEAAHAAAEMVKRGWKPKRTIVFAFWDGEEFGLIGSTEWAEKHQAELDKQLAVYINSDSNGKGSFGGSGSHALEQFVTEVARDNNDPVSGKSLLEARRGRRNRGGAPEDASGAFHLGPLGAGSDYVAFIDHIGASSLNLSFGGEGGGGVYHSIYDSFNWYSHFSDGDYVYGRALAQVMAVALMRLADAPVLPYEFASLARTVRGYADEIQKQASAASKNVELHEVYAQLGRLEGDSKSYEEALAAAKHLAQAPAEKLGKVNEALYRTERGLLSPQGLPGREWYRHQLYAPGLYTGYGAKTLPGVREAVEAGRWDEANQQARQVARALQNFNSQLEEATRLLRAIED